MKIPIAKTTAASVLGCRDVVGMVGSWEVLHRRSYWIVWGNFRHFGNITVWIWNGGPTATRYLTASMRSLFPDRNFYAS